MFRALWLVTLVACGPKSADPSVGSAPAAPEAPPASADTAGRMHSLLHLADTARDRLIRGDLEGARLAGASLASETVPPDLPETWTPLFAEAVGHASTLADAGTRHAAGTALGQIGLACGTCHEATASSERVKLVSLPTDPGAEGRMGRHLWGAEWMWFGLVTSDEATFRLGAGVFATAAAAGDGAATEPETEADVLLARVGQAAADAVAATDDEARAAHFGRLLATCADCHRRTGGGPAGEIEELPLE